MKFLKKRTGRISILGVEPAHLLMARTFIRSLRPMVIGQPDEEPGSTHHDYWVYCQDGGRDIG